MPELADVTYSREATIAAVSDYYSFLTKLYLKDDPVIYPPEAGWPSITTADPHILATLGKSDEVTALLARLPYIRRPGNWHHDAEGAPGCFFADWQDNIKSLTSGRTTGETLRIVSEGAPFYELAPPHVLSLTEGSREIPVMVLDTKLGIIHWEDCPSEIEWDYYSTRVDYDPSDGEDEDEEDEDDEDVNDEDEHLQNEKKVQDNDDDQRDPEILKEELAWRQSATAWAIPDFSRSSKISSGSCSGSLSASIKYGLRRRLMLLTARAWYPCCGISTISTAGRISLDTVSSSA